MILPTRYLLATALLPVTFVSANPEYGVGFELTLDYGVASIQFPNGSHVEVAKIEGNPSYKHRMRTADVQEDDAYIAPDTQTTVGWPSFRDYLPPWLGGHNNTNKHLSGMLKSLKIAIESYQEASVSTAEITVPFPISGTFYDTLRSAAKSVSISIPATPAAPAGRLAALHVYGIGPGKCDYYPSPSDPPDPAQVFLTVEYTRSALTALLIVEECGLYEDLRVLHETHLGSQESPQDIRAELTTALGDVVKMPIEYDGESFKSLSNVVLLGESSESQILQDVLKELLGKQQRSGINTSVVDQHKDPVSRVFAASVAAARLDLIRSNFDRDEI
ncbi:uncharacterized protein N7459_006603 [Penicillium hispanicum]|uniref:uncharacterized protein n=1 Tax=Penicillium hispanicum TaxID=1080232 RepID=UPI002540690B|nr:uncharacterized protein N7459_006603 [Penicillium hispanicum]KAJ5577639.1 hypothetical protein N7459_006603 [Penicillium hispanicum]